MTTIAATIAQAFNEIDILYTHLENKIYVVISHPNNATILYTFRHKETYKDLAFVKITESGASFAAPRIETWVHLEGIENKEKPSTKVQEVVNNRFTHLENK